MKKPLKYYYTWETDKNGNPCNFIAHTVQPLWMASLFDERGIMIPPR